ncbi:MAG: 16S rRNA (cytosine(1402)-N(4))-methyltransferase RsmH [Clostridia bacterium]|nr:16S rRNA (cytosine(1402)-N(4))-methyltransferase RsmH [Clostridia bacterium]
MIGEFSHYSVMLSECIEGLAIRPDGVYVDGTAGGGGHSEQIAKRLDGGRLICFDRDPEAVAAVTGRLAPYEGITVVNERFSEMSRELQALGIQEVNGILLDLGVSSHQLDTDQRGFSYKNEAELDMRMNQKQGKTAQEVVNTYSQEQLTKLFYEYGEERYSRQIAQAICTERERGRMCTTTQLADIIKNAMPIKARSEKGHPAKRCFQALRIEVNGELDELATALQRGWELLADGGRMVILTFHSLEDRMVKQFYKEKTIGCICPKEFPVCVCNHKPEGTLITKKPMLPTREELEVNSRSQSAKLRIIEKIAQ